MSAVFSSYVQVVATQICLGLLIGPARGKFASANQKHYPDLGSDASSVWNFFARLSDVIWRETSGGVVKYRLFSKATYTSNWAQGEKFLCIQKNRTILITLELDIHQN